MRRNRTPLEKVFLVITRKNKKGLGAATGELHLTGLFMRKNEGTLTNIIIILKLPEGIRVNLVSFQQGCRSLKMSMIF